MQSILQFFGQELDGMELCLCKDALECSGMFFVTCGQCAKLCPGARVCNLSWGDHSWSAAIALHPPRSTSSWEFTSVISKTRPKLDEDVSWIFLASPSADDMGGKLWEMGIHGDDIAFSCANIIKYVWYICKKNWNHHVGTSDVIDCHNRISWVWIFRHSWFNYIQYYSIHAQTQPQCIEICWKCLGLPGYVLFCSRQWTSYPQWSHFRSCAAMTKFVWLLAAAAHFLAVVHSTGDLPDIAADTTCSVGEDQCLALGGDVRLDALGRCETWSELVRVFPSFFSHEKSIGNKWT